MVRLINVAAAAALSCAMGPVFADEPPAQTAPVPSQHQLMKDCMAKEKASDAQMTPEQREQMKKTCRDVTKTEEENDKTEKAAEHAPASDSGG